MRKNEFKIVHMKKCSSKTGNQSARDIWVSTELSKLPVGSSLIDVGAGECKYKKFCTHLEYFSQDNTEYDGIGDGTGLQTKLWDTNSIDLVCDLLDIPEDRKFDTVLCTEVLEHVPDPVFALEKMARLCTEDGGTLIITAPFNSLTHFAPYHYCTGFSKFFFHFHLERLGFEIVSLVANGGYFDVMVQELGRINSVRRQFKLGVYKPIDSIFFRIAILCVRKLLRYDGRRMSRKSSELQCFGWHVIAKKRY